MYEKLENEEGLYLEGKERNRDRLSYIKENIYDEPSKFILSWLGRDSYFNNEKIQINDRNYKGCLRCVGILMKISVQIYLI